MGTGVGNGVGTGEGLLEGCGIATCVTAAVGDEVGWTGGGVRVASSDDDGEEKYRCDKA